MSAIDPSGGRVPPITPQLALRVAVLGVLAFALFGIVFFRLWYLQVLSGDQYLKQARDNRVRELTVQAPRGEMLDRHGKVLVDNRTSLSLQVRPDELPGNNKARNNELKRLGEVAQLGFAKIKREIKEQTALVPASPVTLEQKVDKDLVYALRERQDRFPGVSAEQIYVRFRLDTTRAVLGFLDDLLETTPRTGGAKRGSVASG